MQLSPVLCCIILTLVCATKYMYIVKNTSLRIFIQHQAQPDLLVRNVKPLDMNDCDVTM